MKRGVKCCPKYTNVMFAVSKALLCYFLILFHMPISVKIYIIYGLCYWFFFMFVHVRQLVLPCFLNSIPDELF